MTLEDINALKQLGTLELVDRARELGCGLSDFADLDPYDGRWRLRTNDAIRLAIIDRSVERELLDREGPTAELNREKS